MKKADHRSHSWWWDSHISPKNSKWLQENLAEMDTKVNAMLKIIEEDADSFAQRAEMYYRRRPELINLVEEFYRTYRALVERYNFLTREIRQNIAPALQAQLGVSPESAQNSPIDLHLRRGIDGFDIISPSYSYPGASEFDDDNQSEVSTRSWRGHMDEEETSPLGSGVNLESRSFAFRPKFLSLEEETFEKGSQGAVDVDITQLQKDLRRLQDENKTLAAKASEDVSNLKNLHLELSSLQSRMRSLEAEDRLTKKRLKSVLEQEQKLEAENLKLSHALITAKEEKTEIVELRNREIEKSTAAGRKIEELGHEAASLKQELLTAQLQVAVGLEKIKRCEEENLKLQQRLASLLEEKDKDSVAQKEAFEEQIQELQERFLSLEEENAWLKERISQGAVEVKRLEDQLMELTSGKESLEQVLSDLRRQIELLESERFAAVLKSQDLEKELEVSQKDRQSLSDQNLWNTGQIIKLEGLIEELQIKCSRLETENVRCSNLITELESDTNELQELRDRLRAQCEDCEDRCKALQVSESQLKDELGVQSSEITTLHDQKAAVEAITATTRSQIQELQEKLSAISSEKEVLACEFERVSNQAKVSEAYCMGMERKTEQSLEESNRCKQDLAAQAVYVKELEEKLSHLMQAKTGLEKRESESQQVFLELKEKHAQLGVALSHESSLSKNLKDKLSDLENERNMLVVDMLEVQRKLTHLQEEKDLLSNHYTQCQADYQIAVGALRRAEEDLTLRMSELTELHTTTAAKREELENETVSLKKELAKLHAENRSLVQENTDCTRRLADTEEKVQDLEPKLSESLAANAAMAVKLSDAAKHVESLRSELLLVGNEKATLAEDFGLKTAQIFVLQEQIANLEEKEKYINEDLEKSLERIKGFQIEVERLQQLVSDLKGQNSTLTHEKASLQMENLNMKERIQNIEDELSHITEEKQLLIKGITSHMESCKKLEVELKGLEHDKDVLQSLIDALQEQLASSEIECKSLKEENRTFVLKLADVEARLLNLEPQLSNSQLENRALVSEVSEKVKRIEVLEAQIVDLQKEKVALHQEVSVKLEHAAALHEQIHAFKEQERSFQAQLQQRSDVVQSLEAEVARLQSVASKAEEEKISLAHEQKRSLDESLFVQKTIENLKEQLSHVTGERAALVREMATHLEVCQKMETSIKNLENDKTLLEKNLLHAVSLEDQLREEIKDLQKEKEQLSKAFDSEVQSKVEDLQKLQILLNCSLKEQDALTDSLKTRSEEKDMLEVKYADLQVELRKSKQLAMDNAKKLEADIRQLGQTTVALESDLDTKIKEMNMLQDRLVILQSGKKEAEEQVQMDGKQIADLDDEVKMLREALFISQGENERLDKLLGHSVSEHKDIQKALTEAKEELEKQISSYKLLQLEMERTVTSTRELEQGICNLQDEKETLSKLLAASQQKLDSLQGDYKLSQQTSNLHLQEKDEHIQNLHEQLHALESEKFVLQDTLQKLQNDWILAEENLKEELSKLKSENLKCEQNRMAQQELASKLKDEMNRLQSEMTTLQENNMVGASRMADLERELTELQEHTDRASKEFEVKDTELLNLSVKAEQLQQSLLSKEQEIADLKVHLECCNKSKEKLAENFMQLQNEELNLKSQIAGDATSIAELKEAISNLEKDKAALVKDLSVEAGLGLKLQMKILKEINEEFEQKLQFESAEKQQLRADVKALQEVQIPELESKLTKLKTENIAIQTSQQRGAAEAILFEKHVKDLKDEVSSLQKENGKLLQELASQSDRQEDQERKLQQLLAKAIEENEGLRASVHTYIEQHSESQNQVNYLQLQIDEKHRALERHNTIVSEMEGLQRDLEVAKEEISSLKERISSKDDAAAELQDEIANLQNKESAQKEAVESLNSKLTDAKVEINCLQNTTESISSQLEHQSKLVLQMMISIEDIYGMISKDHSKAVPSSGDECLNDVWQCQPVQRGIVTEPTNLEGSVQITEVVVNDNNNNTAELLPPQGTAEEPVLQEFMSTSMPAVKEALETAIIDRIGKLQKLKVEIGDLLKENDSLKSQSLTAWTEYNLVEKSSKELHEQLSHLQAENGRLSLYVKSCNAQIDILQEEAIVRKGNNDELLEELGNADCEVKKLQGILSDLQREGTQVLMLLKERLIVLQEELMELVDVQKQIKWKRDTEAPQHSEHENSLSIMEQRVGLSGLETTVPQSDLQHLSTGKVEWQEEMPELEMRNKCVLDELHSRLHETNLVFAAVDLLKKELLHSGRHVDDKELMVLEPVKELEEQNMEAEPKKSDKQMELTVGQLRYGINLQTRLHQALVDEKLEQELLELKEGRKQLKEELHGQVEQVQRMEEELQRLQKLLEDGDKAGGAENGIVDPNQHQKWQQKKEKLVGRVSKLQENLVLQRQQIVRLQADYAAGALQEEAVTKSLEEQVLVLVSKESAPSMEGWDEEQVNRLSKEMERIKTLDRRHSLELQTMGQELSKVGSLIQTAQQQLLIEEDEQEDEDKDGKAEAVSLGAASSNVSSYQFPLKPRGFDFTWLLLLFNPDKKARMGRSKSSKPWISPPVFLRPMRSRSSSGTVLAKPFRKTAGCCACVSSTNRADHDE